MKVSDKITITNEDCMDLLKRTPDKFYDLAICDPPYGIGFGAFNRTNKASDGTRIKSDKYKNSDWDDGIPNEDYFKELFRVSKEQIIWGGNYFPFIWNYGGKCFIYWHKGNPVPNFADGELAWTSFNKIAKQFDYRYYGNLEGNTSASEKHHPTQKPIQLYEWLLDNYAKEGDKILDTHLGSGSIALACHNRSFSLTACELDTDYYNSAIKRLKTHMQQLTMF